jgi:histidinol phosphatase-like PHP family hydrolase
MAEKHGVDLVLNTDSHSPDDLVSREKALRVARGAGLGEDGFEGMLKNSRRFLARLS